MSEFEDKLSAILGNPQAMSQIMSLAQSLGGSSAGPSSQPEAPIPQETPASTHAVSSDLSGLLGSLGSSGSLDPRLMQLAFRVMNEYQSDDDSRTALLQALRPFVKEQRYAKIDKAIQIAKLSRIIRVALDVFKGGNTDHV